MQYDKTPEEAAAIGRQIYARMQAELEANHWGRLVVIDINSGDYEVGDYVGRSSDMAITRNLLLRRPQAHTWAELIGKKQYAFTQLSWQQTAAYLAARSEQAND